MSVNIYSLRNPITNEIIYVGKTIYALNYRLNHHYTKINLFLNDKYSASNIIRALIDKTHCNCKGYSFKYEINN